MSEVATKAPKVKKEPVVLSVEGILADLDAGLDREKIKAKYNLSHSDMALLFKDAALKGRKPKGATRTKKAPGFILIGGAGVATTDTVVEETATSDGGEAITTNTEAESETVTVVEDAVQNVQAPEVVSAPQETLDKW